MKKLLVYFSMSVLLVISFSHLVRANQNDIRAIEGCLSKDTIATLSKPEYEIAKVSDVEHQDFWRWYLVRVRTNPHASVVSQYNVIGIRRDNQCVGFTPIPEFRPDMRSYAPQVIVDQFTRIMEEDHRQGYQNYVQQIRRDYPGKTDEELRRMGVFGLD